MSLHWGVNLVSIQDQDIPLTHIRTVNRSLDGHFCTDVSGSSSHHFIDLGAHQGESIVGFVEYLKYYKIGDRYSLTSFEASRQAQIWCPLTHSAMRCRDHFTSMYISNFAIAGSQRICEFRDDGSAGSSLHSSKPLNKNEVKVLVPTVDINTVIEMIPDRPANLIIKLNIEGAEYEVLDAVLKNPASLEKITEVWLDFHGHQFEEKWKYLESELRILKGLRAHNIECYDVDFMSGFYKGYNNHPPTKKKVTSLDLITPYLDV